MNIFLIIVGGIAAATGVAWGLHLLRLKDHSGVTRADFAAVFQKYNIDTDISTAVYDQFQEVGTWKGFMPSPTDSLERTYKTVDEDLEENLKDILQRLGLEMPHSGMLQEWEGRIETLSDVVRWVDWVRTKQDPTALLAPK